jgi:hypothetical protein
MNTVHDFAQFKAEARKISMVTAYDAWSARLIARSQVDAVLVGDSAAMVMHGHKTTLAATVRLMALHTRAVAHAIEGKFLVADLPFLSYRKGIARAMEAVGALVISGAQAVKLEGVDGHADVIRQVIGSGVPVMGHVGLTPQSVHQPRISAGRRTSSRISAASPWSSSVCRRISPRASRGNCTSPPSALARASAPTDRSSSCRISGVWTRVTAHASFAGISMARAC